MTEPSLVPTGNQSTFKLKFPYFFLIFVSNCLHTFCLYVFWFMLFLFLFVINYVLSTSIITKFVLLPSSPLMSAKQQHVHNKKIYDEDDNCSLASSYPYHDFRFSAVSIYFLFVVHTLVFWFYFLTIIYSTTATSVRTNKFRVTVPVAPKFTCADRLERRKEVNLISRSTCEVKLLVRCII